MRSLQHQPFQLNRVRPYAFVADADESIAMAFDERVVRRFGTSLYLDHHEPFAIFLMDRETDLRHGIHLHLDRLADELGVALRIGKAGERTIVRNAEEQPTALGVRERTDALEPARRILALKHQLLVVRRRLAYVVPQQQSSPRFAAYYTIISAMPPLMQYIHV